MSAASLRLPLAITHAADPRLIGTIFSAPRTSWALEVLIANGEKGLRSIDCSAMQLGYYIWCIRQELGDHAVITKMEKHNGPFAGEHARYILSDQTLRVERIKHPKKNPAKATTIQQGLNPNSNTALEGGIDADI